MLRLIPLALVALTFASCDTMRDATDEAGRDASRGVVAEVIAIHRPDVPKERFDAHVDCVVARAQALEVRELAKAAVTGVNEATVIIVTNILQRPDTAECIRLAAAGKPIS